MAPVVVLDANGQPLSPTTAKKARKLIAQGKAALVSKEPFTIQLPYSVELPPKPGQIEKERVGEGKRFLLHICCGPCGTYPIERLGRKDSRSQASGTIPTFTPGRNTSGGRRVCRSTLKQPACP